MHVIGRDYRNGVPIKLEIDQGRIAGVQHCELEENRNDLLFIAPGLLDLQVNGYQGTDFNEAHLTTSKISRLVKLLWAQGVTSFFPTVITNSAERIKQVLKRIVTACYEDEDVGHSIPGIHLEGPFISAEDGPRGAHDKAYVIPPDWELFLSWQEVAKGKIRLITLSPEWPGSYGFIKKCVSSGVKVAIGHTAANNDQIKEAIAAGASLSTHLGNAAHLQLPRHPNYIWDQLASDELWVSMIADGFHLPEQVLKVFLKVKAQKSFLVSDVTSFGGLPPGVYEAHIGGKVTLNAEGRLFMSHSPALLAGSAQSLIGCINHLVKTGLLSVYEAWNMASVKPAEFLYGHNSVPFQTGQPADLILFEKSDTGVEMLQTIKSGKKVFDKHEKDDQV